MKKINIRIFNKIIIFFLALLNILIILPEYQVYAISQSTYNSIIGYTPFYDPNAISCSSSSSSVTLVGSDNEQQAWNFFASKGVPNITNAAIMGNFKQESGFSPTIIQIGGQGNSNNPNIAGGLGWGIAQWTPGGKVIGIAKGLNINTPIYTLSTQLNITWDEMIGSSPSGYNNVISKMIPMNNLPQEVSFFRDNFEGIPTVTKYRNRHTYAQVALKLYGNGPNPTKTGSFSSVSASCNQSSASINSYTNPLRGVKNIQAERIDMGVDYGGTGPVYALGTGIIKNLTNSGWMYNGNDAFITEQLSSGPAKGDYVYVAEGCSVASGLHIGEQVTSNTVLCNMTSSIETGWAQPPGNGNTMASTTPGTYNSGEFNGNNTTAFGLNYNQLLVKLGAPSGKNQDPAMGSLGGALPSNWPTW